MRKKPEVKWKKSCVFNSWTTYFPVFFFFFFFILSHLICYSQFTLLQCQFSRPIEERNDYGKNVKLSLAESWRTICYHSYNQICVYVIFCFQFPFLSCNSIFFAVKSSFSLFMHRLFNWTQVWYATLEMDQNSKV